MLKLTAVLLVIFAYTSSANLAEGIVEKYLTAIGGKEKINAVKGWEIKISQWNAMTKATEDVLMKFQGDDAFYVSQKMQGKDNIFVSDGKKSWGISPMLQMNEVSEIPAEVLPSLKASFEQTFRLIKGLFLDYKEKGIKVEFLGKEDLNGKSVNKIKISDPEDKDNVQKMFAYFDNTTKLISKVNIETPQGNMAFVFKSFKNDKDATYPDNIDIEMNGNVMATLNVKYVKVNPKFDASTFAKPKVK